MQDNLHTACKSACFARGVTTPLALCVCSSTVIRFGIRLEKNRAGMAASFEISMAQDVVADTAAPVTGTQLWLCVTLYPPVRHLAAPAPPVLVIPRCRVNRTWT